MRRTILKLVWWGVVVLAVAPGDSRAVPEDGAVTRSLEDLSACVNAPCTCPYRPVCTAMLAGGGCPDCAQQCWAQGATRGTAWEEARMTAERATERAAEAQVCTLLQQICGLGDEPPACQVADEPVAGIVRRR